MFQSFILIMPCMCKASCNYFLSRSRLGKPTWNSLSSLVTEELLQGNRGHMHTGYKRQGLAHKCTTVYVVSHSQTQTMDINVTLHICLACIARHRAIWTMFCLASQDILVKFNDVNHLVDNLVDHFVKHMI